MSPLPAHDWLDKRFAAQWTALAAELNPVREEQLGLLVELLRARDPETVLDLGVGSGLVAEQVLDALAKTRLIGIDFSSAMLALAHERLTRFEGRVKLIEVDLASVFVAGCADSPAEAAISVQTLHNLDPSAHRRLLSSVADALLPGAILVIADRFAVAPELFGAFRIMWDRLGIDEGRNPEEHAEWLRTNRDQPVALITELQWLDEAGFDADCIQCLGNRAVVVGRRR